MSDIDLLINRNKKLIIKIGADYQKSLDNKEIFNELLLDLKDFFGNSKSILDYIWKDKGLKGNFPLRNSEIDLINCTKNINSKIIENIKPFQPYNNTTIKNLNIINNSYKHVSLVPQKKISETRIIVSNNTGNVSWGSGVTFGPGVSIMGVPIDIKTQRPISNNIVNTKEEIWINFIFDNTNIKDLDDNINVIHFTKSVMDEIEKIVKIF